MPFLCHFINLDSGKAEIDTAVPREIFVKEIILESKSKIAVTLGKLNEEGRAYFYFL